MCWLDSPEAAHSGGFMFQWFTMSSGEAEKRDGSQVAISGTQPLGELWPYVWGLVKPKSYLQVASDPSTLQGLKYGS